LIAEYSSSSGSNTTVSYDYSAFENINGKSLPTYAYAAASDGDDGYAEISYDSNGNVIQTAYQDNDGQTDAYTQYTYNANGILICAEYYESYSSDSDPYLTETIEFTYE
jgi:GTPase SAR1 family protein